MKHTTPGHSKEAEILKDILNSEKKSSELIDKARQEREGILEDAKSNSLRMIAQKQEQIRNAEQKKLAEFRDKTALMRSEKLDEGKEAVTQVKSSAKKNISKAVEHVMGKFEEMI